MLTYFYVRSALGQDIRNPLTKFPAFSARGTGNEGGTIRALGVPAAQV